MITTNLRRTSAIAHLVTRLAGDGAPGVRFAVLNRGPGVGVDGTIKGVAQAMDLDVVDIRMSMLTGDELAEGSQTRCHYEKLLGSMGDALVLLQDCDATPPATLRGAIEMVAAQLTDRDDRPRAVLVLLTTGGDIRPIREAIDRVTGGARIPFDIVG